MKTILVILSLFISSFKLSAQEPCIIKMDAIRGVYTGDCSGGKANGLGKSVGMDQYEGQFKDGYPDGKGTYIWKDGHYFVGFYKKGNKEGKGDMYYEAANGKDSVISGFWKKDKYVGEYEKQYVVVSNSGNITRVDCRLMETKGNDINITVHYLKGLAMVRDVSAMTGTYFNKSDQVLGNNSVTRIQQVTFPFRATFYFSNGENAEIQFNQKGSYDVYIDMQ